jgi:hypothetical protein
MSAGPDASVPGIDTVTEYPSLPPSIPADPVRRGRQARQQPDVTNGGADAMSAIRRCLPHASARSHDDLGDSPGAPCPYFFAARPCWGLGGIMRGEAAHQGRTDQTWAGVLTAVSQQLVLVGSAAWHEAPALRPLWRLH